MEKPEELWNKERELIESKIRSFKELPVEPFTLKYTRNKWLKEPGHTMYEVYKLMLQDDYNLMGRQMPAEDGMEFKMQIVAEAKEYKERLPLLKKYNDAVTGGDIEVAKKAIKEIMAFNEERYKMKSEEIMSAGKAGMADKTLRHHTLVVEGRLAESAERAIHSEKALKPKPMRYVESAMPPERERINKIKEEMRRAKKEKKNEILEEV